MLTSALLALLLTSSPSMSCRRCDLALSGRPAPSPQRLVEIDAELARLPRSWQAKSIAGAATFATLGTLTAGGSIASGLGAGAIFSVLGQQKGDGLARGIAGAILAPVGFVAAGLALMLAVMSAICWGGLISLTAEANVQLEDASIRREALEQERTDYEHGGVSRAPPSTTLRVVNVAL